jgi:hypothetical protein
MSASKKINFPPLDSIVCRPSSNNRIDGYSVLRSTIDVLADLADVVESFGQPKVTLSKAKLFSFGRMKEHYGPQKGLCDVIITKANSLTSAFIEMRKENIVFFYETTSASFFRFLGAELITSSCNPPRISGHDQEGPINANGGGWPDVGVFRRGCRLRVLQANP